MSQGYGYNVYAGIGVESTYGTAVAGSKWFQIMSESLKGSRPRIPNKALGFLSMGRTTRGRASVSGNIVTPFMWNGCERLIADCFGASAVTTSGGNPYTHTYALKAAMPVGLTVLVNRDAANIGTGSMRQYVGCHVNKTKLSQKIDEPLYIDTEFIGSNFSNVNIQAATFPTWDPIDYGYATIASMDADGSPTALKIVSFELEISNMLEARQYLTDFKSAGVHRTDQRQITISAEVEFESLAVLSAIDAATEHDWQFKWMKDSGVDTVNTLNITTPKAFFIEGEPETGGPGPYRMSLKMNPEFSSADNDELVLVLKNTSSAI